MKRRTFVQSAAAAAVTSLVAPWAQAQAWPEKPIRMIVAQPAGSGPDSIARMVGEQLSRQWKQQIVVDNRPGGQNAIGAQAAARSTPDGYNFYFATSAALITNPYLFKSLPYDPLKDFVPVGMIGRVPFVLAVNTSSPAKNLQEFLAQAKANPGKVTIANEGPKTFGGMMTRLFGSQAGVQVSSVPYVSIGAAVTQTVGGQTEAVMGDVPALIQMIKAGRLRPIAVTTARPVAGLETVPSIAEVIPGFDYAGFMAIVAPAGTPKEAIQRFNRDLDAVLSDKEMAAKLLAVGPMTEGAGTPEQMAAFLQAEHTRWAKLTKDIGILPE